jgi:phage recombination protein Bet
MTTELATSTTQPRSVIRDMSERFGMEPQAFEAALRATVVPRDCSPAQFAAFLLVAKKYDLDPVTKQIYAFPSKGGGITPIVGIDGWLHLANSHPAFNGMEFEDHIEGGNLIAITCRVYRKDRDKPMCCTEYMSECKRNTDPWNKSPGRMLRHRATIQAIRYAFSFSGIVDEDEYGRIESPVQQPAEVRQPLKLIDLDDTDTTAEPHIEAVSHLRTRWDEYVGSSMENASDAAFLAWCNRNGQCDATTPAELTDDAIERCNIIIDEITSN